MSFFTLSGNKLAATVIAAGALVVTGTGVAVSLPGDPASQVSEADSPAAAATESAEPAPTETEADSPEPTPTETETATDEPEPAPTDTETEEPEAAPTETETDEPEPTETDEADSAESTPVGPDATGPAAFGLCNSYTHGGLKNPKSTAYKALVKAAGSESSIAAYCETVAAPQDRPEDVPAEPSTGTSGSSDEQQVQRQQVQQQPVPQQQQGAASVNQGVGHGNQGAPAAKGNPGHASNNSHKPSDRGQR